MKARRGRSSPWATAPTSCAPCWTRSPSRTATAIEVVVVGNGSPLPGAPRRRAHRRAAGEPRHPRRPQRRHRGLRPRRPRRRRAALPRRRRAAAQRRTPPSCAARPSRRTRELGIISFRIADPETGVTQRRHVPRLRASDPMRSSRVTTFLGGANAVRTQVFARGRRAARRVLLRARGDRPGLAGARRGLDDRLPVRHGAAPPDDRPGPARGLPPHGGPQPGLAGPPQSARARWCRSTSASGCCSPCARRPSRPGAAGLVRRLPGGLGDARAVRGGP